MSSGSALGLVLLAIKCIFIFFPRFKVKKNIRKHLKRMGKRMKKRSGIARLIIAIALVTFVALTAVLS